MSADLLNSRRGVFSLLRRRARQAYRLGRLEESLVLYGQALQWAREHGSDDDVDRASCGRASVAIELGQGEALVPELRDILMRSTSDENCFLAANNIGRAYEIQRQHRKTAFYARIARDRALRVNSREWLASAHNLLGNACLASSGLDEAEKEYRAALELVPASMKTWRALIEQNIGYAFALRGRLRDSLRLLLRSLRRLRAAGAHRFAAAVRVDLAFAYLEHDRPERALRHARLAIATSEGDRETLKNALYLQGEAANRLGASGEARSSFERLQREFYPASNHLPDFLLSVGVRQLLSLRA